MIASITPVGYWFGLPAWLRISPASTLTERERRLSRSATLDGGAVWNDGGFSEADRTFTLLVRGLTADQAADLESVLSFAQVYVSLPSGFFVARAKNFNLSGTAEVRITLWIESRII